MSIFGVNDCSETEMNPNDFFPVVLQDLFEPELCENIRREHFPNHFCEVSYNRNTLQMKHVLQVRKKFGLAELDVSKINHKSKPSWKTESTKVPKRLLTCLEYLVDLLGKELKKENRTMVAFSNCQTLRDFSRKRKTKRRVKKDDGGDVDETNKQGEMRDETSNVPNRKLLLFFKNMCDVVNSFARGGESSQMNQRVGFFLAEGWKAKGGNKTDPICLVFQANHDSVLSMVTELVDSIKRVASMQKNQLQTLKFKGILVKN